jgi:Golgi SNAP receptor complex protein 1
MLNSVNTRMGGVLGQIPGINSVLNMINARRRRDTLIVGGLIGFLVVLLFLWASR